MKLTHLLSAVSLLAAVAASPALAAQSYVSRTGSDANSASGCSQSAPCATLATAITAAGAGGEVTCLNRGGFMSNATLSITFSVSILCGQGDADIGFALVTINTAATDTVVLQGIVADFRNTGGNIINFNGAGALHIRNSTLRNSSTSNGVLFQPNGAGTLFITDTVIDGNANSGILIKPQAGGYTNAHLRNVRLENNSLHGLFVDGASSNIGINVNIEDGSATGNAQNGIGAFNATAGGAPIAISVMGTQITGNYINGVGALGQAVSGLGSAAVKIGNSMITANNNGLATGGVGQLITLGGNHVHSNSNNGAFTGSLATQ
jgi:hypothetical protein